MCLAISWLIRHADTDAQEAENYPPLEQHAPQCLYGGHLRFVFQLSHKLWLIYKAWQMSKIYLWILIHLAEHFECSVFKTLKKKPFNQHSLALRNSGGIFTSIVDTYNKCLYPYKGWNQNVAMTPSPFKYFMKIWWKMWNFNNYWVLLVDINVINF